MSIIAVAVKHLIAAGVTGDALVAAIAEMEDARPAQVDAVAERRRAYDRERKRNKPKNSGGIPVESAESVPPNDNISNPPPLDAKASCPPLADRVVEAWNEGPGSNGAPKARPLDANRRKLLSLRTREHSEAEVFEAIRNVGASEFHCGKNDRGWTANLGWLLKSPENFQKALEMGSTQQARAGPAEPINLAQRILQREQQRAQA